VVALLRGASGEGLELVALLHGAAG
jgi:hypothetical protein